MNLQLSKQRGGPPLTRRQHLLTIIRRAAAITGLRDQLKPHEDLSISLVDEATITRVNEQFLGHRGSTDVITFDYRAGETSLARGDDGAEILVCFDVATREAARRRRSSIAVEVVLYVVHGMLHLTGLDDSDARTAATMRRAERRVLAVLQRECRFDGLFG